MGKCDYKIARGVSANCEAPSVQGARNTGYIINSEDIDTDNIEYAEGSEGTVVESLPLKAGAQAYEIYVPGNTPFTGTQTAMVEGTYRNKFEKTVSIAILDNGPEVSQKLITKLANGSFVVILENKYQGADKKNTFEIYGLEQGLKMSEGTAEKYNDESEGGWLVSLRESNAPTAGVYFFNEDIDTTRKAIESLCSKAVVEKPQS